GLVACGPWRRRVRVCRARVLAGALPEFRGRVGRLVADGYRHPRNLWGGSGEEARGTVGLGGGVRRAQRRRVGVRAALPAGHARRDHGTDRRLCDRGWCRAARGSVQTQLARAGVGADMAELSLTNKEEETLTKAWGACHGVRRH